MRQIATLLFCLIVVAAAAAAHAQDLKLEVIEVASVTMQRTTTITKYFDEFGELIDEVESDPVDSEPVETVTQIVEAVSLASNVSVTADDVNRKPISAKRIGNTNKFAIGAGTGRVWVRVKAVDFDKHIFDEQTVVVENSSNPTPTPTPTPTPDNPEPGPDDPNASLADRIHAAALRVNSPSRSQTAATLASIYRSVAGRSAGLSAMDATGMVKETRRQIHEKIDASERQHWGQWSKDYVTILQSEKLGNDKGKHITAWQQVASGLQRIAPRSTPPPSPPN